MANTDWTRLLDGYSLLAIKQWAEGKFAPLVSPIFTGTVEIPTSFKITGLTSTGLIKYTWNASNQKATLSIDTTSYLSSQTWRAIQVGGQSAIAANVNTALNFVNGTHSVQFTYSNGLYAEVDLTKYKPDGSTAFLDSSNKIAVAYLPDSVLGQLQYVGTWNATTPSWPSGRTKLKGEYWICSTAGSKWPDGTATTGITFVVGDWAIWTGAGTQADPYRWEKVDNTDAISSITLVSGDALTGPVTIPAASDTAYGLVKVYAVENAEIAISNSTRNYGVHRQPSGKLFVNVPWTDNDHNYYHTPSYSTGLKIGTGTGVNDLYVPVATASAYGVIKTYAVRSSAITATTGGTTSGRYYGVELDSNGKAFVNVPWTDNDHNYYHTPSYSSGLKIGTGTGLNDLYVPNADIQQAGIVTTTAQSFAGKKSFINGVDIHATQVDDYYLKLYEDGEVFALLSIAYDEQDSHIFGDLSIKLTNDAGDNYTEYLFKNEGTSYRYYVATEEWVDANYSRDGHNHDDRYVRYDAATSLTDTQKAQARSNIGAGTGNGTVTQVKVGSTAYNPSSGVVSLPAYPTKSSWNYDDVYVKYSAAQTLTDAQKTQARNNIGAASSGHTHAISLVSGGTATVNLAYNTAYTLTAGGSSVIFKMPASDNTDHYHTPSYSTGLKIGTGTGLNDLYVPAATTTQAGVMTTGDQDFQGKKSFQADVNVVTAILLDHPSVSTGGRVRLHYEKPVTASGIKNVNVNTFTQGEATNILNGLNADGTARS